MIWVSFWGDGNVLKLDNGDTCTTLNMLKTTELYTFKEAFYGIDLYMSTKLNIL